MTKKKKSKLPVSPFFIGIVIGLAAVAAWGFWHQFQNLEQVGLYQYCLEVERSPELQVPCTCRPKALNATEEYEEVYQRTEGTCICQCQISETEEKIFEIRKAKGDYTPPPQIPDF